jgi:hypothetical protein
VLGGKLADGYLGSGQSFDVGDFDGDGKVDIAAAECSTDPNTFICDSGSTADVLIWTGAEIAAWKARGVFSTTLSTLAPIVLSDSSGALVGGTVRAAGHVTGGSGAGDDLLISNFQLSDGSAAPYQLAILQRAGSWSASGSSKLFSSGSPAITFIDLPSDEIDSDPDAATDFDNVEAATFTYATASGDLTGLLVSMVYVNGSNPNQTDTGQNEHDLRLFGGDEIAAGGALTWSVGVSLPIPASLAVSSGDIYGYSVAGGRDAIGDTHNDLLIADKDNGQVYAYDGTQLLGTGVPSSGPPAVIYYGAKAESDRRIGSGAELLADLDGDGKAEIAGATDPTEGAVPVYFWFSQTGDGGALTQSLPAPPALPFFPTSSCTVTSTTFCFTPSRGQELATPASLATSSFGQAVGSGHVAALVGRDLVILSQAINGDGTHGGSLVIMR